MSDEWVRILITAGVPIVVLYVGWTVTSITRMRLDIANLRTHVSDNYPNNKDMDEVKLKLDKVVETLYRMEGRMGAHDSGS